LLPTTTLLPKLGRLNKRKQYLLRTDSMHFLPDDLFNLLKDPKANGQVAIDPRSDLSDHSRSHHETVANDLRLSRIVP
jgi:hypothetical protein